MNPAFAYVYDEALADKRWQREVEELENELAQRGIEGITARASLLCEGKQLVKQFVRQGIKNLILVGQDRLVQSIVPLLPELNTTVGFIPIGPSLIGALLGVPSGPKAVAVIAARLVERLDLGQINGRPFLLEVTAPRTIAGIQVEQAYWLRPSVKGAIAIRNFSQAPGGQIANPKDGQLEVVIQAEAVRDGVGWLFGKKTLTETKVYLKEGVMAAQDSFQLFVDGEALQGKTFSFSVMPNKVSFITGWRLSN